MGDVVHGRLLWSAGEARPGIWVQVRTESDIPWDTGLTIWTDRAERPPELRRLDGRVGILGHLALMASAVNLLMDSCHAGGRRKLVAPGPSANSTKYQSSAIRERHRLASCLDHPSVRLRYITLTNTARPLRSASSDCRCNDLGTRDHRISPLFRITTKESFPPTVT